MSTLMTDRNDRGPPAASAEGFYAAGSGGGSGGSSNGGSGGSKGGGSGKGDGDDNDEQPSSGPSFLWKLYSLALQLRQPPVLVLLVVLSVLRMNLMGRKMIKEDEAEEAASVDADGVDDSHELAKQLFDDLLDDSQDDPWSDPSWIGSNLAEPPSISQPKQSAPSTLNKLRSWIARLLSGGGGVKDTTAKLMYGT